MSNKIATPYDFGKYKIILTNHSGKRIDISNLVVELNFFESLSLPYVTGSLMVVDSANVFNATNFMGQEELDISVTDINGALKIKKSFVVSSLRRQEDAFCRAFLSRDEDKLRRRSKRAVVAMASSKKRPKKQRENIYTQPDIGTTPYQMKDDLPAVGPEFDLSQNRKQYVVVW